MMIREKSGEGEGESWRSSGLGGCGEECWMENGEQGRSYELNLATPRCTKIRTDVCWVFDLRQMQLPRLRLQIMIFPSQPLHIEVTSFEELMKGGEGTFTTSCKHKDKR
jgi:hypothetical protein